MPRIKKRSDGRYQSKILLGHDVTGKAVYKFVYAKTQSELTEKKTQAILNAKEKLTKSRYIDIDTYPLSNWLDDWMNNIMKGRIRQNTWESYESNIRNHITPALGDIPIGKLQPPAIRAFYDEKKASGLSDRTVRYCHTILSAALKQAVLDEIINKNPCIIAAAGKIRKSVRKKEINVFSQEQINTLLISATGWHKLIFFVAWGTGFRREELLGLRWQDIDFKQGTISVNQTVIVTKEFGVVIDKPKNDSSYRTIPVQKEILKDLQKYRAVVRSKQLSNLTYKDNDLVFAKDTGELRDPRQLSKDFKTYVIKANLSDKFHLHDLRHTHATQLLKMGIHPKVVQYRLGHSTFQQTMDTYSHVIPQMQDGIADMMSGLLKNKSTEAENYNNAEAK